MDLALLAAAVEVARTMLTEELSAAHAAMFTLPDGLLDADARKLPSETYDQTRRALFF
jgi:hypothetical protein